MLKIRIILKKPNNASLLYPIRIQGLTVYCEHDTKTKKTNNYIAKKIFKVFTYLKAAKYEKQTNPQLIAKHCFVASFWFMFRAFHLA